MYTTQAGSFILTRVKTKISELPQGQVDGGVWESESNSAKTRPVGSMYLISEMTQKCMAADLCVTVCQTHSSSFPHLMLT